MKQLAERLGAKGPFGAEDLPFAVQRIGQDIQLARDEPGQETNAMRLAKLQNGLGHGIESLGPGCPPVSKGKPMPWCCRPTRQPPDPEDREENPDGEEIRKKLPVVDGKVEATLRPQAGELIVAERRTPARVGGVREQEQVRLMRL